MKVKRPVNNRVMFKEMIDNILLSEREAEAMLKEAAKKAQEIGVNSHNAADEYAEAAEKEIKAAVKQIMKAASDEGEKKAAQMISESGELHARIGSAAQKNHDEAVDRIIREFLSSGNI